MLVKSEVMFTGKHQCIKPAFTHDLQTVIGVNFTGVVPGRAKAEASSTLLAPGYIATCMLHHKVRCAIYTEVAFSSSHSHGYTLALVLSAQA